MGRAIIVTCSNPPCDRTDLYAKDLCHRCYNYQWRNDKAWTPAPPLVTLRELDEYVLEHDAHYGYVPSARTIAAHFGRGGRNYVLGLLNELRERGRLRKVGRRGGARWVVVHRGEVDCVSG